VVLVISGMAALWALLYGISAFRVLGEDESKSVPGLRTISLALGIVYLVAAGIEVFGVVAASMQHVAMVRIYCLLSVLASILVLGGNLAQLVFHFTQKNHLISMCAAENTGDTVYYGWGFFSPSHRSTLTGKEAKKWCNREWENDSVSSIIALIIEMFLAVLFVSIVFAYYRQLIDPTSPVNVSFPDRPGFAPQSYNPPYEPQYYPPPPGAPSVPYDQRFAPPYEANKLPGYDGDVKYEGDAGYKRRQNSDDRNSTYKEDPFGDFDHNSSYGHGKKDTSSEFEEMDLTSRPRPGERDTF